MRTIHPSPLLKFALLLDAAGSGAMALLQLAASSALTDALQLPRMLLVESGLFMAGYAVLLVVLARSARVWSALIGVIAIGNVGWALGCAALWATGAVTPTGWGLGFLAVHAASVLLFATLQGLGLRASRVADRAPLATAH
ncbi:hypothetical protein HLB44_01415 [Aquincola sp. S2]|uniref:Transmembrane protein n=1 Tax=Pseudaquabacterium terrae TaxID=2732868 RepID=A0ABX2E9Z5_9BURK|nr:hypothetical protein [Aquabacterium terrae]NRF65633.1 hypothetical protein [Aquabacterium terrae]